VAALGLACVGLIPDWQSLPAAIVLGAGVYFAALVGKLKREDANLLSRVMPFRFAKGVTTLLCGPAAGPS